MKSPKPSGRSEPIDADANADVNASASVTAHPGMAEIGPLLERAKTSATLAERTRLARELHDSVTQALHSIALYSDAARLALESGKADVAAAHIAEVRNSARQGMAEMRRLIFELRPPIVEEAGLVGALRSRIESVESRAGVKADLHAQITCDLPQAIECELYHIALEALNNMMKHADASNVVVRLDCPPGAIRLQVQDDGVGFDPSAVGTGGGFGLKCMRERANGLGGELTIQSTPGQGTLVLVEVMR